MHKQSQQTLPTLYHQAKLYLEQLQLAPESKRQMFTQIPHQFTLSSSEKATNTKEEQEEEEVGFWLCLESRFAAF